MERVYTCPLGSECERIVDGKIEQCRWLTTVNGRDENGEMTSDQRCAMEWLPLMLVDQIGTGMQIAASVQSLRNETIKRQDAALGRLDGQISHNS